jgi:PIN domain nuclease of toxin-antitoxin system
MASYGESGLLNVPHADPFDRMLAAQAMLEGMTLVSADAALAQFDIPILW